MIIGIVQWKWLDASIELIYSIECFNTMTSASIINTQSKHKWLDFNVDNFGLLMCVKNKNLRFAVKQNGGKRKEGRVERGKNYFEKSGAIIQDMTDRGVFHERKHTRDDGSG